MRSSPAGAGAPVALLLPFVLGRRRNRSIRPGRAAGCTVLAVLRSSAPHSSACVVRVRVRLRLSPMLHCLRRDTGVIRARSRPLRPGHTAAPQPPHRASGPAQHGGSGRVRGAAKGLGSRPRKARAKRAAAPGGAFKTGGCADPSVRRSPPAGTPSCPRNARGPARGGARAR